MNISMLTISFIIFIIVTFVFRLKLKNDICCLEYDDWLRERGYKKVLITFVSDDVIDESMSNDIVTQKTLVCYIHTGLLNFVVKKKSFSDISVYPEKPNFNQVKDTKEIVINTSLISIVSEI